MESSMIKLKNKRKRKKSALKYITVLILILLFAIEEQPKDDTLTVAPVKMSRTGKPIVKTVKVTFEDGTPVSHVTYHNTLEPFHVEHVGE